MAWHKPGGVFDYFGYDPNKRIRYLNRVRWNKTGHFDHDYRVTKPDNVFRVVLIGDSYVESVQVPLDFTFHKLTEATLNKADLVENGKRFEIIALGNSGFGQRENIDVLRTQGAKYDPDLVILTLCGNDFCDDDPELKRQMILTGGSITPRVRRLAHHGYLALAFMAKRMEDIARNRIEISPELLQWSRDENPRVEAAWLRSLDYLKASRDLCEARGIAFLVLYLGSEIEVQYELDPKGAIAGLKSMGGPHGTINWDISKSMKRVRSYCEKFHINLACLVGPLAEAQGRTGKVVFSDHYSFFGHEAVAKILTCFMKEFTILGKNIKDSINSCFGP
ncbi:MAG: SGNH/GDSL hydrolase family protein, partial [Deltaproteobacteria bacterium]|nr:SGNH/GDSL hydrolase family protein [Deltaproteobacteria bacterium]